MIIDLKDFFIPFKPESIDISKYSKKEDLFINNITVFSEKNPIKSFENFDIALIGVQDERNSDNKGTCKAPDLIRKELYKLYIPSTVNIIDIGNLKNGKTVKDTYIALTDLVYELLKEELVVIILGGSKDLIIPVCKVYKKGKKAFSLCSVEPKFDLGELNDIVSSDTYLSEVIKNNNKLFNYSNIGFQSYYNSLKDINYINENFETVRLGIAVSKLSQNEPYIRDADFFSIDIKSVKSSDAPGVNSTSVNGFYGEEICQLSKYAGFSDKVSVFGLFEVNPDYDNDNKTVELSAQVIWHFIQSFYNRKNEYPESIIKKFRKYIVNIDGISDNVCFYKSTKTGRWWVEVNYNVKNDERSKIISCSYEDYLKATRNEIPERWWNFFNKMN